MSAARGGFNDPWLSFNSGDAAADNNTAEQWGDPEGSAAAPPNPAAPFGGFGGFGE